VIKGMAFETSGFIVLVNINSRDAVQASRRDVDIMREIADRPYVVATYASMVDEKVTADEVRQILDLPAQVPLLNCSLRDPEQAGEIIDRLVELIP
jgi:signal recognition particle receptor subunit beta